MCKHSGCVIAAVAAVGLAVGAVPAHAQNFLQGSPDTIWYGNVRLEGAPAEMFPHDGGPDRTGGAFRLGSSGLSRRCHDRVSGNEQT